MTLLQILTDICSRVGDVYLDRYKARAQDHFLRALVSMIKEGNYTDNDIKGYVKLKTDLTFTTNPLDISALKLLKIDGIMPNPQVPNNFTVYFKDFNDFTLMSQVEELQPLATEVFIYQVGINLYAVYKATGSNFVPATKPLYMKYIEDIDPTTWVDASIMTGTPFWMTRSFIRSGINIATATLLEEVNT